MNKKVKKAEVKKVNGFTQSMNDCDYNLVEQYQEEQIAEQQSANTKNNTELFHRLSSSFKHK